jgi:hypothetical protein
MNANLWLTHLLSVLVFLRHPRERRIFVRHEQFLADPEGVIGQILHSLGFSAAVPDLTSLRPGLPLEGNVLIEEEAISVKRSTRAPVRSSRVTTLLQLPWAPVFSRLAPAATAQPPQESAPQAARR